MPLTPDLESLIGGAQRKLLPPGHDPVPLRRPTIFEQQVAAQERSWRRQEGFLIASAAVLIMLGMCIGFAVGRWW